MDIVRQVYSSHPSHIHNLDCCWFHRKFCFLLMIHCKSLTLLDLFLKVWVYIRCTYWTLHILTLISFINDWFMARAIGAKCFVICSTTTIAKIIETFKRVQVVITNAISYQICSSSTLVIVKSGMFKSWQEVPIELHVFILTFPGWIVFLQFSSELLKFFLWKLILIAGSWLVSSTLQGIWSLNEMSQVIWVWQIEICKLEFIWRLFWNTEVWKF